jgi:hypothetical protein
MAHRFWVGGAGFKLGAFVLGLGVGALLTGSAEADSLSCDRRIVAEGDSSYKVRELCGEPDAMEQHVVKRKVTTKEAYSCDQGTCYRTKPSVAEVLVDRWTYDFGRRRFIQFLTFEQGSLVRVESGSYGFKD